MSPDTYKLCSHQIRVFVAGSDLVKPRLALHMTIPYRMAWNCVHFFQECDEVGGFESDPLAITRIWVIFHVDHLLMEISAILFGVLIVLTVSTKTNLCPRL